MLYEDDAVLVCVKPAGVAVQTRQPGQPDMESILKNERAGRGEPPEIYVVHRLDQPVSGVMVFAKTKEAAASLGRQIAARAADKCYYAMVEGEPPRKKGTLVDELLRDGKTNTSSVVAHGTCGAKRAELSYEVLEASGTRAVLRIKLATGRHHQIRVQLANAGMPIVGDRKYNFRENLCRTNRPLLLCSYRIGFRHPVTHRKMEFEIDKPFALS